MLPHQRTCAETSNPDRSGSRCCYPSGEGLKSIFERFHAEPPVLIGAPPDPDPLPFFRPARTKSGCHIPHRRFGYERPRSEEHTSELQSLRRTSYAVFCLKKKKTQTKQ